MTCRRSLKLSLTFAKKNKDRNAPSHSIGASNSIAAESPNTLTTSKPEPLGYTLDALGRYRPNYQKIEKSAKQQPKPEPIAERGVAQPSSRLVPIQKDGTFSPEVERIEVTAKRIKRDGTFRQRVLGTYGMACIICGYSNHVEAAHLDPKHQVSDDRTENGAPLCPNHHWELDHGLLTAEKVRLKRDSL